MKPRAVVVDTNVVVAGLLTKDPESPTARVLLGMIDATFAFLLSPALLTEYREVLLRPPIRKLHGLDERQIDAVLTGIVANAVVREPGESAENAPEPGDQHLWDLVSCEPATVLVTGDAELLRRPPEGRSVVSPAGVLDLSS